MIEKTGPLGKIVARGVALSGAGNLLLRLLDLAIAILLLRWLSLYEYGVYRLCLAAFDFGTGFFLTGLENVVISDVSGALSREPRRGKAIFSAYILLMAVIGVILWMIFYFGFSLFKTWVPGGAFYLPIISFLFLWAPLETIYKWQFQIYLDFGWAALIKIFREVTRFLAVVGAFYLFSFGIREALWTLVIAGVLPVLIAIIGYRRPYLLIIPTFAEMKTAFGELFLRHGKWAISDDFLSNTGKSIRPFIIKTFVGTEAVAIFSVAINFLSYTTSIFPLREVLTSVFPRQLDDRNRLAEQVKKSAKYATYAYLLLAVLGSLGTPIVIFVFFPKYITSLPLYWILILGLPWLGYRSVMHPVFFTLREQRTLFMLTAFRLFIITVLGIMLVYLFGVLGAAFEVLILNILLTPAFSRALKKVLPEWTGSFRDLFFFDAYDKLVIATVWSGLRQKVTRFL